MQRAALSAGLWGISLIVAMSQMMSDYIHPKRGFAIKKPSTWIADDSDPSVLIAFEAPQDSSFYLVISDAPLPFAFASEGTYRNAADGFSPEFRSAVAQELEIDASQVREIGRRVHEVRGLKVATLDFRAPAPDNWVLRARTRLVVADGRLYAITISADEEEFTANEALVNQILDSFEPKDRASGQFPVRTFAIALGVACLAGVLMLGGILLLVRKLTGRL